MAGRTQCFDPRQEMRLQDYEIFHYKDVKLSNVAVHHHDFYEVYLLLSGSVTYSVEGRCYPLECGDLLLVNPMELHQLRVTSNRKPYERYVLWLNPGFLHRLSTPNTNLTGCFDSSAPNHTNLLRLGKSQRLNMQSIMEELVRETYEPSFGHDMAALGLLMRFMVELNRLVMHSQIERVDDGSDVIRQVLAYINHYYDKPLSLDQLAGEFFISKYHLSHEFNRVVGTSVYRYIILKRLVMAKQMLLSGIPPTEVYLKCGFHDYSNFYRCFKNEYGITPKQFVEQARQTLQGSY